MSTDKLKAISKQTIANLGLAGIVEAEGGEEFIEVTGTKAGEFFADKYGEKYTGEPWQDILVAREVVRILGATFKEEIRLALDFYAKTNEEKKIYAEVGKNLHPSKEGRSVNFQVNPSYWRFSALPPEQRDLAIYRLGIVANYMYVQDQHHQPEAFVRKAKSIIHERTSDMPPF